MLMVKRPVCRCRGTQRQKLNINGMFAQSAIFNRVYNKKVYHIREKTATPSSAHDQICLLRGFAAKIHFMVGASSIPQNALRWRFVGALFCLLGSPAVFCAAVFGQFARFFCAFSVCRRGDPIVGARPNLFTSRLCREDSLYGRRLLFPAKRASLAFCGSPFFRYL